MTQDNDNGTPTDVSSLELLGAVKSFLMESAVPALSGRDQFNARVAANVLGIVEREQSINEDLVALDAKAAQQWLPDAHPGANIPQRLSRALAERQLEPDTDFLDYLKARQLLVTAINNPRYASRAIAEKKWRTLDT